MNISPLIYVSAGRSCMFLGGSFAVATLLLVYVMCFVNVIVFDVVVDNDAAPMLVWEFLVYH